MFSGIIETTGTILNITPTSGGCQLTISVSDFLHTTTIGDSISVNGVCLTVISFTSEQFTVDVSKETMRLTTFGSGKVGDILNLEHTLTLGKGIHGHLVSGHVDTLGTVVKIDEIGDNWHLEIEIPSEFDKYIVKKGSITINGVSLTINAISDSIFALNIIPHTLKSTNLQDLSQGAQVNVEIDLIARHLEKLIQAQH